MEAALIGAGQITGQYLSCPTPCRASKMPGPGYL
jgi:hypothetical protein